MAALSLVARRYGFEELLSLQSAAPVSGYVLQKLNDHPDISSLCGQTGLRRSSHNSKSLSEITNQQRSYLGNRKKMSNSPPESESQRVSESNLENDHPNVHWNFRKRNSSDQSSQPHSAPTGIAAQQSENFRRFYRAVISPTHVRVTAGGRIVPNTRTTAPPLFGWNSDKFHYESKTPAAEGESNRSTQSAQALQMSSSAGYTSLIPGSFWPAFSIPPQAPQFALPTVAAQQQSMPGKDASFNQASNTSQQPEEVPATLQPSVIAYPYPISHPSQFDHTKPFTFNGHIVYPLATGMQPPQNAIPVPIAMLGNPNLMAQPPAPVPQAATYLQAPHPVPTHPFIFPKAINQLPTNPIMSMNPEQAISASPLIPTGILPLSQLLSTQIQHFRRQLAMFEDELLKQGNLNQQSPLIHHRNILAGQIKDLEGYLQTQISQEGAFQDNLASTQHNPNTAFEGTQNGGAAPLNQPVNAASNFEKNDTSENGKQELDNGDSGNHRAVKQGYNHDQAMKTRLTLAAAMAPPFKPRAQSVVTNTSYGKMSPSLSPGLCGNKSPETEEQIEARLLSKCQTDWGQSSTSGDHILPSVIPRSRTFHEGSLEPQFGGLFPSYQRSNTFHGSDALKLTTYLPNTAYHAAPYLVGILPRGIPPNLVRPDDIVYSRPLTEDEIRARYLYWGKAPRSAQTGLPKFDGKDFFPPSPIKEAAQTTQDGQFVSTLVDPNSTPERLGFSRLFEGYSTPSPVHRLHLQDIAPLQPVLQPIFRKTASSRQTDSPVNNTEGSTHLGRDIESIKTTEQVHSSLDVVADGRVSPAPELDFSYLFINKSPSPHGIDDITSRYELLDQSNYLQHVREKGTADQSPIQRSDDQTSKSFERAVNNVEPSLLNSPEVDGHCSDSTLEIKLTPKLKGQTFAERVENFRSADQQTLFLQNMLKAQPPRASGALSGAVTSATAQGLLPQYRGSAAASLAPTGKALTPEKSVEEPYHKGNSSFQATSPWSPYVRAGTSSEPFASYYERSLHTAGSSEGLDAEEYMRYLTKKDDNNKRLAEQAWQHDTTGNRSFNGPE